eukprot:Phypoly_transcript_29785.p1 GENE.Phypoly_transcript_29785~~Phypoly_transcript_29785.p1  ORF type:complete len:121 (+),score=4.25 Phypoly_transcript_29785:48-410(+)
MQRVKSRVRANDFLRVHEFFTRNFIHFSMVFTRKKSCTRYGFFTRSSLRVIYPVPLLEGRMWFPLPSFVHSHILFLINFGREEMGDKKLEKQKQKIPELKFNNFQAHTCLPKRIGGEDIF